MLLKILKVLGAAVAGACIVIPIGLWIQSTPNGQIGIDPAPTAYRLKQMAVSLEDALARGDRQAANALLDPAIDVLRTINDQAIPAGSRMHNCKLAAMHLNSGLINLADGQPWLSKPQFEMALAACK